MKNCRKQWIYLIKLVVVIAYFKCMWGGNEVKMENKKVEITSIYKIIKPRKGGFFTPSIRLHVNNEHKVVKLLS